MDPARVLVIAVGIDDYQLPSMSLSGAAAYAERIVDWALRCGVPGTNVWLGSSRPSTDVPDGRAVRFIEPTRAGIEDALVDAAKFDADFLLFYWCGHGVLHERRRAVFTSDVRDGVMRIHNIDSMQRYLASDTVSHLKDQLLVIDACANFYDSVKVSDRLISSDSLDIGRDRAVNQFTLYSAGQGQIARFDQVARSTEFSDTVLGWLEEQVRFPMDPKSLTGKVKRRFAELRTERRFRQRPSTCVITCLHDEDENWEYRGGIPVPGSVFCDVDGTALSLAHTRRAAAAVTKLDALTSNLDIRGALLSVLSDIPSSDELELHALVAKVMVHDRVAQLFSVLEPRVANDLEWLALLEIRSSWQRQRKIAEVEGFFDIVSTRQIVEAFWRSGAESATDDAPTELGVALDRVADFVDCKILNRFVAALEYATGASVDDDWFELPDNQLRALRDEAANFDYRRPRIVIEIPNGINNLERFAWPSSVGCHRYVPGLPSPWRPIEWHECDPSPAGVRAVVNELVADTEQHCALGFIMPRAAFDEMPEAWDFETIVDEATPHWVYRPTVLHCAERRILPSVNVNWQQKTRTILARLEHYRADLSWVPSSTSRDVRTWVRDSHSACFGMELVSDKLGGKLKHDLLMAAINAGAPFIVWASPHDEDWSETKLKLQRLVEQGPFHEVPERVHHWRESGSRTALNRVRLLWDDPSMLPPAPMLRGMP
ncbi:VMAP-C domain-containing protein [Nocardia concava]|uniref:VMAP-C domain-containing protein n=1 Tax=Nocardia concava TaxID=257281 RepID=UPI00059437AA|nr:caspase family protein [Nocardia concava]